MHFQLVLGPYLCLKGLGCGWWGWRCFSGHSLLALRALTFLPNWTAIGCLIGLGLLHVDKTTLKTGGGKNKTAASKTIFLHRSMCFGKPFPLFSFLLPPRKPNRLDHDKTCTLPAELISQHKHLCLYCSQIWSCIINKQFWELSISCLKTC